MVSVAGALCILICVTTAFGILSALIDWWYISRLQSSEIRVAEDAARVLTGRASERAIQALLRVLKNDTLPEPSFRPPHSRLKGRLSRAVFTLLVQVDKRGVPGLVTALKDDDVLLRAWATNVLMHLDLDEQAAEALALRVSDAREVPLVRLLATRALGHMGNSWIMTLVCLIDTLSNENTHESYTVLEEVMLQILRVRLKEQGIQVRGLDEVDSESSGEFSPELCWSQHGVVMGNRAYRVLVFAPRVHYVNRGVPLTVLVVTNACHIAAWTECYIPDTFRSAVLQRDNKGYSLTCYAGPNATRSTCFRLSCESIGPCSE